MGSQRLLDREENEERRISSINTWSASQFQGGVEFPVRWQMSVEAAEWNGEGEPQVLYVTGIHIFLEL